MLCAGTVIFMKTIRIAGALFLVGSVLLVSSLAVSRQAALSAKLIRLHVVANSDSEADQEQKLRARDAVLSYISDENWQSREQAQAWLSQHLEDVERAAEAALPEGTDAVVTLQQERFPTRAYETFTLPAGAYLTLRVSIGAAQGHNWWCVVYPSLCAASVSSFSDVGLTAAETDWITRDTAENRIEFKLLEWMEKLF